MKKLLSLLCGILYLFVASAQDKPSPESEALYKKLMSGINGKHQQWLQTKTADVNRLQLGPATVISQANLYGIGAGLNEMDIEALAFLVLMQAAKSAQEDLKAIMAQVKSINEQKAKQRALLSAMQKQQVVTVTQLDSFRLLLNYTQQIQKKLNTDNIRQQPPGSASRLSGKKETDAIIDQLKKDLDSMNEMGEMESLRLQMAMDRMSKMMSTLSNILKKISQTAESITQNLK